MVTTTGRDDGTSRSPTPELWPRIKRGLRRRLRWGLWALRKRTEKWLGATDTHWGRVVMDRETARFVDSLDPRTKSALEISGEKWKDRGFASYRSAQYPEFDVCKDTLDETFDVIIIEQVLEHVLWPYRAVRNLWRMLNPGGTLIVTTPFMLRIHNFPVDCSRWTEVGLKYLLAEAGFDLEDIETGSWGNRACIRAASGLRADFGDWTLWNPRFHSLHNEPDFPVVVWAFARKRP